MKVSSKYFNSVLEHSHENEIRVIRDYIIAIRHTLAENAYTQPESALALANDQSILASVIKLSNDVVSPNLTNHIVIGIGGSNLGTKAIYDAMYGYFDILQPERIPRMIFADTTDPKYIHALHDFVAQNFNKPEELLFTAVTKSGTTTETIATLEIILGISPLIENRLIIITGEDSLLSRLAKEKDISVLTQPQAVSGRYSVMSAVGLFPLITVGIDVEHIQQGASNITDECLNDNLEQNPAALSALTLYNLMKKDYRIHDTFLFHPELESLGKWCRQLIGESLGKSTDTNGSPILRTLSPTVSVGTTDLHSTAQLYLSQPGDKIFTFVSTEHDLSDIKVPMNRIFPNIVENIEGKSADTIMSTTLDAVQENFQDKDIPYIDIKLEQISEFELGKFMQFKMIETMFLAKLMNVNAFNQPDVEEYKQKTRNLLGKI
jgi:glucose-6-phosphate isomerase